MAGFVRKIAKQFIVTTNVCVTICMLLLYVLPYTRPGVSWFINVLALLFPFFLLMQILFIVFWLIVKPKLFLIPVVSLLLCWGLISNAVGINFPGKMQAKTDSTLRIATWNTHLFNFYENNGDLDDDMIRTARSFKADVLAVQEFVFSLDSNSAISLERVKKRLGYKYVITANDRAFGVHTYPAPHKERYHPFCVALFSNYPIIKWEKVQSKKEYNQTFLRADLKAGKDTIRIFNIHLQSMHFVNKEYDFIENIEEQDAETVNDNGRSILRKMRAAYLLRAGQSKKIKEEVDKSPYPVIVCGDMNDVPNSYAYQKISSGLKDVFTEKGTGIGPTFQFLSPTLRIDYILHSKSLSVQQIKIVRPSPGDHNPIIADFKLPQ